MTAATTTVRGAVLLVLVLAPVAARAEQQKTRLEVRETAAHEVVAGIDEASLVVSPDGAHVAYVAKDDSGMVAVVDGRAGTRYRVIAPISFSPDGKRHAYKATRADDKWTFVVDGKEGPLHDGPQAAVHVFSPDGSRTAYAASLPPKEGEAPQSALVVDGVIGKPYKLVEQQPWFSRDGKRLALVAGAGKGPDFRTFVVVDGVDGAGYLRIGSMMYDDRSKAFAWSPDAKRWGHSAEKAKGVEVVVIDGVEGKPYDGVRGPLFSADGKHWAHPAKRKGKWVVVVDGQEAGKEYDEVDGLRFGPAGALAYAGRREMSWVVVVDGVEGKEYGRVGPYSIHFSPDGKRVAYWATSGTRPPPIFFVLDGVEQGAYENVGANRTLAWTSFTFAADGKKTAFAGQKDGKWLVVVDGVPGTPYDSLPIFSPVLGPQGDVAYAAEKEGQVVLVANGAETGPYKALVPGTRVAFHGPRSFHVLVRDERRISRVEVDIRDE
jgi:hypothetical protein